MFVYKKIVLIVLQKLEASIYYQITQILTCLAASIIFNISRQKINAFGKIKKKIYEAYGILEANMAQPSFHKRKLKKSLTQC